jgi:5-methylthioribose kinase
MIEVDANSLLDYFTNAGARHWESLGLSSADVSDARVSELAWGVSNIVLRVDTPSLSFVVKQSREKLRTAIDWFSQLERVWRETAMMDALNSVLPDGVVPRVLFEDRDNFLFGMQAVEPDHLVWKAELLAGRVDRSIALTLAQHLAKIHAFEVESHINQNSNLSQLVNRDIFDELRLDPFYRYMAETIPELHDTLLDLIESTLLFRPMSLVLADFSPKNILLTSQGPVIVDFETGHLGDPAFDIGFFLSHLLLKVIHHAASPNPENGSALFSAAQEFWNKYSATICQKASWLLPKTRAVDSTPRFEGQCVRHLAACMLSRVDGKSRVDYLPATAQQQLVREVSREFLLGECSTMAEAFNELSDRIKV